MFLVNTLHIRFVVIDDDVVVVVVVGDDDVIVHDDNDHMIRNLLTISSVEDLQLGFAYTLEM